MCILTPEFLPTWGGIGTYTYYLARGLQDHADVHVVTSDTVPPVEDIPGLERVQVHRLRSTRQGQAGASSARFQIAVARSLPRIVCDHGIDLVHSNHAQMADFLARLRSLDASTVVTVHTTLGTQLEGTRGGTPLVAPQGVERAVLRHRRLLRLAERRYLRRSRSVIFVSRWVRDQAVQTYDLRPTNSRVVRNAVDTNLFRPNHEGLFRGVPEGPWDPAERPFTLLFAGRLLAQKGLGTLLEAMRFLPPEARLLVAGPGDPEPWRELASRFGIPSDRVSFLGTVPFERMPALYHRADVVVLPSFAESCPMTALEAMAAGVPLIAANVGGVPEIVEDGRTGWLFPAGDAASLSDRVRTVMEDGAPVEGVVRRAREWTEAGATLGQMADSTRSFYAEALEEENT